MIVVFILHVMHRAAVALAECTAIVLMKAALHRRMFICLVIVGILVAMSFEIPARRLYAVVESLPLGVAILRWGIVPPALLPRIWL